MKKILILILLTSCSAQHQLSKLRKNHPELFQDKIIATVHHDTLITKETHKDSIINNIYSRDTVFIHDGRETVKYVYEGGSKAYISGTVKSDTVIKIDTVKSKQTTIIKEVKAPKTAWENFCDISVILCLIILFVRYIGLPVAKSFFPKIPF